MLCLCSRVRVFSLFGLVFTMVLNGTWQSSAAGADGRARPFGVSRRQLSGPTTSPAAYDAPPVVPFQANAWRTRFALTPIAAAKRRDKVGATLSPAFCFLPPAAGGPYIDLERAEPPPPIVDTEWRQGAFDMGAGSHVSLMFAGRSSEEVVEMGETLEQSWFESLKVSALFTNDEKEKLFSNLSAMKAGAEGASSASAPSVADRCAAHGSRVVRLIMEVMCKGRL